MAIERTISIVKPDAVGKNVIGKIYSRFEDNGLSIVAAKNEAPQRARSPRVLCSAQRASFLRQFGCLYDQRPCHDSGAGR